MKVKEFMNLLTQWLGGFGEEEGLRLGSADSRITGITTCWMATDKVIDFTIRKNHNLIVAHEDLLFPPDYSFGFSLKKQGVLDAKRLPVLEKQKISVIRLHSTADRHFVLDGFGDALSLGTPVIKEGFYRVYEIKPVTLEEFALNVKNKLKIPGVRVTGKPSRKVRSIGGLWGGLGLSVNADFINEILKYNIDTAIAGETDEYAMRALVDMNAGLVEVGHEISEEPGLRNFTAALRKKTAPLPVYYCSNPLPWSLF